MAAPRNIDWESVEKDYRAGLLSLREMAEAHGVSHVMISKKAKTLGWVRDLKAKIQAKADELVNRSLVNESVNAVNEREIIEANAERIAQVRGEHRKDISRFRNLALKLLAELEAETENPELFEELGIIMRADDDKGQDKRNDLYHKVISGANRIDSAKKLSETLKTLIALEREAYGITGADQGSEHAKFTQIIRNIVDTACN